MKIITYCPECRREQLHLNAKPYFFTPSDVSLPRIDTQAEINRAEDAGQDVYEVFS